MTDKQATILAIKVLTEKINDLKELESQINENEFKQLLQARINDLNEAKVIFQKSLYNQ